jgi:hypothetical protein
MSSSQWLIELDGVLLRAPKIIQYAALAFTGLVIVLSALPHVPREYLDYSEVTWLRNIAQVERYGTDTIADMYAAKVVLNSPRDMYTRASLEQTPREARTWSKEASAPYPPMMLLADAALFAIGEATGIGFYGMILVILGSFLILSAWYFLHTRWYLFPLLYLNCSYLAFRFVEVQDGSYLVMLLVIVLALLLARRGSGSATIGHVLVGLAITMKVLPLFYLSYLRRMPRAAAASFVAMLVVGLIAPVFIFDNYLYIYRFHSEVKGRWPAGIGAAALAAGVTWMLVRLDPILDFDWEDRIGWSLVPLAMLLGFKMNVARHLVMALLVPDRHAIRNIAVSIALALHALFPSVIELGGVLPIAACVLGLGLWLSARFRRRTGNAPGSHDRAHRGNRPDRGDENGGGSDEQDRTVCRRMARVRWVRRRLSLTRPDELIPDAWPRQHVARFLRGIAERPPNHRDRDGEVVLLDRNIGPDAFHQGVLVHDTVVRHQHPQHIERFTRQPHRRAIAQHTPLAGIELELVETHGFFHGIDRQSVAGIGLRTGQRVDQCCTSECRF